ncbi:MAG TPA: fused MFS/spermidine synthase [Bryobacteraceae bacterium]|nr:fused MFS/spermidine synthase [Bryobacteraceae bacterium]
MAFYALTIFLSSFLLFQVQPIIAKIILPWFGGSANVWNTCMLFFQAALLGGYTYAHLLYDRLPSPKQSKAHIGLLAASLLTLPILPGANWKPQGSENPALLILGLLAATIGLPYFLLSTTGPLLQAWYSRANAGAVPYRLFALSNFASLLALISYPLFVEPALDSSRQAWIWSGGYALFVVVCGAVAWRVRNDSPAAPAAGEGGDPVAAPSWPLRLLWVGLAACPSVLLLSVTTHMTQDIASIPFLWIVPLVLYLLSFILTFETSKIYWRWIWLPLLAVSLFFMLRIEMENAPEITMVQRLAACAGAMFTAAMTCHGELASLKPHPRYLTNFYVALSVGGALGGLFVGMVAPMTFQAYHEYPIGWWLTFALVLAALATHFREFAQTRAGMAVFTVFLAALGVYGGAWVNVQKRFLSGYRVTERNFYGTLRVEDEGDFNDKTRVRQLLHGVINHGQQFLNPERRREATTYYCKESGVGTAILTRNEFLPQRVGVIGLGTGTLATYGRVGDEYHIFEINPLVVRLARGEFTFLGQSPAQTQVHLGDARLTLERMEPLHLDVLAVDAFSGDSVPVHLLTKEAMELYWRHLNPDGILAVHISNRYLDLEGVVQTGAQATGKTALEFSDERDESDETCFGSTWILVMNEATKKSHAAQLMAGKTMESPAGFRIWTDGFSNLISVLRTK